MSVPALRSGEVAQLARCEQVIESGLRTFVEVGEALMEIRDSRLYRESHRSFEDYCRERWGFTRARASQVIQAAEVSRILDTSPSSAGQAAELVPLKAEPAKVREAWAEANRRADAEGRKVTAEVVREVVTDFKPSLKTEAKRLGMTKRPTLHEAAVRVVTEAQKRGQTYHVPLEAMRALMLAIGKEQ